MATRTVPPSIRTLLFWLPLVLAFLPGCGTGGQGDPQGAIQPPILITFDLHSDPEPPAMTLSERRVYFRRQLDNAEWLLDAVEPYGARISFLAVGEFYEFCVEETERDACLPLIQRLKESGGILGTHQHHQYRAGSHDWPDIPNAYTNPSEEDVRRVWADGHRFTDEAVRQAFSLTDEAEIDGINTAAESQANLPDPKQLMQEYGYTIREGGADQDLIPFFNHVPWNPFRPGNTNISEDLATEFVTIPQGMVIGHIGLHKGYWQDGSPARKKAELLELYASWLQRERTEAEPKVWSFGWGVHTQDLDQGSDSRAAVEEIIPWLRQQFVDRSSLLGNPQGRFASYLEVRDAYLAWEQEHPGISSFDYPLDAKDYSAYPYLEWANRYLRVSIFDAELEAPEGARLFRLAAGSYRMLLAFSEEAGGTLDASALGGATVRLVNLETGDSGEADPGAVPLGAGSFAICVPADCEAILALGEQDAQDDSCSQADPACPQGKVCATVVGRCVPDCREPGFFCPVDRPSCDRQTGLCLPGGAVGVSSELLSVTNPKSGVDWWAKAFYPDDASGAKRYPAILMVPGGSGAGSQSENDPDPSRNPARLASNGFVVVIFDADGRGNTAGVEDYCGHTHQDGLKALVEAVAALSYVDRARMGISTGSFGITMGSGVLARYPALALKFLLDVEGPADRNDTGHCDASNTGHIYHDCNDDAWWAEREAAAFIRQVPVPYLRLQHQRDHVQPDNLHCILMVNNATAAPVGGNGVSPWTRVNRAADNQINQTYSEASPPVYLDNTLQFDLPALWSEMLALVL